MPATADEIAPPPMSEWSDALLQNPHAVADKRGRVQKMFAAIAPSYDLNNRLHSLWMDQLWRRKAVKLAGVKPTDRVVDVACGTGDLTLQFLRAITKSKSRQALRAILRRDQDEWDRLVPSLDERNVIGIDFTFEMLPIARAKIRPGLAYRMLDRPLDVLEGPPKEFHPTVAAATRAGYIYNGITWLNGDAQSLPLPDACCDVVSIAFGIRNVQDPAAALREFRRVLRPGGRLIILEFSLPTNRLLRWFYNCYFRKVLPRTATLISGDKTGAYKYLPESVNTFISREAMATMMAEAGFVDVRQKPMTFGVCVCYRGLVVD